MDDEPAISAAALYEKTLEQWRLSDLSDIGVACLPDTIAEKKPPAQLSGNYVVQMLSIIDVCEFRESERELCAKCFVARNSKLNVIFGAHFTRYSRICVRSATSIVQQKN